MSYSSTDTSSSFNNEIKGEVMDSRSSSCTCNLPITKKALVHAYGLVHCSPSGKFPMTLLSSLAKNQDVNESWLRDFHSFAGIKSFFLVFLRDYMFQLS